MLEPSIIRGSVYYNTAQPVAFIFRGTLLSSSCCLSREILEVAGQLAHVVVVVDGVFVLQRFDFSRFLCLHEEGLQCNVCVLERWVTVDVHGPLQLD